MSETDADALLRCFEPCFIRVLELLDARSPEADAAAARASLLELLDESAFSAEGRFPAQTALAARRFTTAWTDERLASDDWPGREAWRTHPLQSDWGEGRASGEWFFDAVARLNPARPEDAAPAALALRCLSLGFDGKMYYTPREIADLRRTLTLRFGFARPPRPFPPQAAGTANYTRRGAGALLRWLAPLAAAAILAGAYALATEFSTG